MCRDCLPDVGTVFNGDGGSVQDAVDFLLHNFSESSRLWIRMGPGAAGANTGGQKQRRERERYGNLLIS